MSRRGLRSRTAALARPRGRQAMRREQEAGADTGIGRSKTAADSTSRAEIAGLLPMIASTELPIDVPNCSRCSMPMRLIRVVPSVSQNHAEGQTFACEKCGTTVTRTVRLG